MLGRRNQALNVFFAPQTVAVIGATETPGSAGRTVLWNLVSHPFGGTVYPVNPKRSSVLGIKAYSNVSVVPEKVDLAVIATPAEIVPGIVAECAAAGVRGAIILSEGFKECGPEGVTREQQILEQAGRSGLRVIGPNSGGVMSPVTGLHATCAGAMARPGNVGFISQSGALCAAILDWSHQEMVGFSHFVSIGSMLDVGWGDLIDYLGDDPKTRSIVIYMESVGDARSFLSAAREVALAKPIIVMKAGRTEVAARAAASHTGSLSGNDAVLDAAFRRSGVLRVHTIGELFHMAEVLAKQPRPKGPHLTILTNAGGPGVIATDALISHGGELAELSPDTMQALDELLPRHWSHGNPVDILGDAPPERFAKAVEILTRDPQSDGLLVVLAPQAMTDPGRTAEQLRPFAKLDGKPILASWMGGAEIAAGEKILNRANIPTFAHPDTAARAFTLMWRYSYNLNGLYETPIVPDPLEHAGDRALAGDLIRRARLAGRTILSEVESKKVLSCYSIPVVETRVALSEQAAVMAADEFGYPVVLKLYSETLTHKSDVGGVWLNLWSPTAVRKAYQAICESVTDMAGAEHFLGVTVQPMISNGGLELIVGSSLDAQFGPVLMVGSGGKLVEAYKDRALALPPLNTTLARRMMEQTRVFAALKGIRGMPPVDLPALERLLVMFSQLVIEQHWIKEVDINPLLLAAGKQIALDARIVVHGPEVSEESLPKLSIRPYPSQYVAPWTMNNGLDVVIRPIRPEDEPLMIAFHETLSDRSVFFRYFHPMRLTQRVAHERLIRICFIDYSREIALVADWKDSQTDAQEILGVGRLIQSHGNKEAEFAVLVSDKCQRCGLGTELLRRLVHVGCEEGLDRITGNIHPDNRHMLRICERLGFSRKYSMEEGLIRAELNLRH
ncbi:MAG TPA: bifunctional acetate--CoA ligase family protein/GNAT family N-acetyltransferase [Acidobacteriota bacterium]|nr:bifunctional acetate--CoA ligase family protein/GNAT family N-acetyltransferase [Acidobacteriota bacterium]